MIVLFLFVSYFDEHEHAPLHVEALRRGVLRAERRLSLLPADFEHASAKSRYSFTSVTECFRRVEVFVFKS
jgi:hypothetical protein